MAESSKMPRVAWLTQRCDPTDPVRERLVYHVERLRNVVHPQIGQSLTEEEVQQLIDNGVDVNIHPVSGWA